MGSTFGDPDDAVFRAICVSSPHAVLSADPDGVIVWANPAAERTFGWPADELVGQPLTVITTEAEEGYAHDARRRLFAGETLEPLVGDGRRRDGEVFTISVATSARRDADGRVLGISLIAADISESVRVQQELADALARTRARFDQVDTPQALLDLDATFVDVNDAACALLKRPREELVGQSAIELLLPVDPADAQEKYRALREGTVSSISGEVLALAGDGSRVPLLLDLGIVRDENGPREVALFAHDLSEVREAQRRLEAQDAFVRALNRRATDIVVVTDEETRIRYVSTSVDNLLGYSREEVLGRTVVDFLEPEDRPDSLERAERLLAAGPGATVRQMLRARDSSGAVHWLDGITTNCLDDPDIAGIVSNLRDVTAEVEARNALRDSEVRFRAIAQTAQEGIVALAPDGAVIFANEMMASIAGVPIDDIYASGLHGLLDGPEAARMDERLALLGQEGSENYEIGYHHPDGTEHIWVVTASPLAYDDGRPMGSLAMVSDVTVAKADEAQLKHRALHDSLTGLPSRALLVDRLSMAAARREREGGRGVAVLFLDLDHFKTVNDERGHEAGDLLLTEVARRLLESVRETDTVARLGGDEFAVVCADADSADAERVAARIQERLALPIVIGDDPVTIAASIGIALSPPYAVSDLLRFADAAMYEAKAAGRNQVTTFTGSSPSD